VYDLLTWTLHWSTWPDFLLADFNPAKAPVVPNSWYLQVAEPWFRRRTAGYLVSTATDVFSLTLARRMIDWQNHKETIKMYAVTKQKTNR
jgi:hypothetical protein